MPTVEKEMKITNKLGLHARAAGQFRKTAAAYAANIEVVRNNMTVNAKSLLGLMALEACQGTTIKVVAKGEDARQAVEAIERLVNDKFGEGE